MRYDAQIEIEERTNKNGEPYEILAVYMKASSGEFLRIQEVYIKAPLKDIIRFVSSSYQDPDDDTK